MVDNIHCIVNFVGKLELDYILHILDKQMDKQMDRLDFGKVKVMHNFRMLEQGHLHQHRLHNDLIFFVVLLSKQLVLDPKVSRLHCRFQMMLVHCISQQLYIQISLLV